APDTRRVLDTVAHDIRQIAATLTAEIEPV
ncbi:MAG: hypothetical protein JWP02_3997, partial [Acidimicrobiales bacterium]|nr:hypothetical protein [Acidimicrobiales bacterium]